jgi:hypothetical protein
MRECVFANMCMYSHVRVHLCARACSRLSMCSYTHTHTHNRICMYLYMYACMYVCMYVCIYVCMYACTSFIHLDTCLLCKRMISRSGTFALCLSFCVYDPSRTGIYMYLSTSMHICLLYHVCAAVNMFLSFC